MNEKPEYWDLFDMKTDAFVRVMQRGDGMIPPTQYHNTVEIIPTNRKGYMMITQRDFSKLRGAGEFEFPAGSVLAGETVIDAAVRELWEETGLRPKTLYKVQEAKIPGMKRTTFLAYIPNLLNEKITLQEGETVSYRFLTVNQWLRVISQGLFDTFRVAMYSDKLYNTIRKVVDTPPDEPAPAPAKKVLKKGGGL